MNRPSWSEALAEFLLHKRAEGIREETLRGYERHVKQFFNRYPRAWEDMSALRQSAFEWLSEPVKPATYNLRLVYVRAFLKWCREQGYVDDNPLQKFKRRKADPRIVELSEETLRELLQLPDQKHFPGSETMPFCFSRLIRAFARMRRFNYSQKISTFERSACTFAPKYPRRKPYVFFPSLHRRRRRFESSSKHTIRTGMLRRRSFAHSTVARLTGIPGMNG